MQTSGCTVKAWKMLYTMVSEQPESQQSQASQCSVMASAQLPSCGLLAHNL